MFQLSPIALATAIIFVQDDQDGALAWHLQRADGHGAERPSTAKCAFPDENDFGCLAPIRCASRWSARRLHCSDRWGRAGDLADEVQEATAVAADHDALAAVCGGPWQVRGVTERRRNILQLARRLSAASRTSGDRLSARRDLRGATACRLGEEAISVEHDRSCQAGREDSLEGITTRPASTAACR